MDIRDKFAGVVLGTAIGDALGYPVEFMSVEQIRQKYGSAGVRELIPSGKDSRGKRCALYSDDTQMFRAVCEGLIRAGPEGSLDAAAEEVAEEFIAWAFGPENTRAPGQSCMVGCQNLQNGAAWRMAGKENGGGCGAAMRSMAYGLWWWQDPDIAAVWAAEHALMTHRSAMAQASAAAVAAGVANGILTSNWDSVVQSMVDAAQKYDPGTARMILQAREDADRPLTPPMYVLNRWRGWKGDEAVAASVYCGIAQRSFVGAVLLAVNSPGDSDSLGAITGALVGAVNGARGSAPEIKDASLEASLNTLYGLSQEIVGIPVEWIQNVERSDELVTLAVRMWKAWHQAHGVVHVPLARRGEEKPLAEGHVADVIEFRKKRA